MNLDEPIQISVLISVFVHLVTSLKSRLGVKVFKFQVYVASPSNTVYSHALDNTWKLWEGGVSEFLVDSLFGIASWIYSEWHAAPICSSRLVFSQSVSLISQWCNGTVVLTQLQLWGIPVLFLLERSESQSDTSTWKNILYMLLYKPVEKRSIHAFLK